MVSSVFSCFGVCAFFWIFFSFFLVLGVGVRVEFLGVFFGACSLGRVLWDVFFGVVLLLLLCGAFRFIVILRHRGSYSSCAQVSPCRSLFCAYLPSPSLRRCCVVSCFIIPYLFPPSFPVFSWARVCLLHFLTFFHSTISFGSFLLATLIHSHLHLICFLVVIVISAQYHNTNFALLFSFHVPSSNQQKMRIKRSVNP